MRYFIDRDDCGHWYLVEADKRDGWQAWLDSDDEDIIDELPSFARRIGAPSWLTFENPYHGSSAI